VLSIGIQRGLSVLLEMAAQTQASILSLSLNLAVGSLGRTPVFFYSQVGEEACSSQTLFADVLREDNFPAVV
jgi:hypothetical protein